MGDASVWEGVCVHASGVWLWLRGDEISTDLTSRRCAVFLHMLRYSRSVYHMLYELNNQWTCAYYIALNCGPFHSYFTVFNVIVRYGTTEFHKWPYWMLIDKLTEDCESNTVDFCKQLWCMQKMDVILCEIGYVRTILCNITLNSWVAFLHGIIIY